MHITDFACRFDGKLYYSIAAEIREAAQEKPPVWISTMQAASLGRLLLCPEL
jgi:hypothetical protein